MSARREQPFGQPLRRGAERGAALAGLVLGLGLTGTGVAFILYYFIVQHLGAVRAAGVTYIPPVVALAIGSLLAHEPLRPMNLVAMLLILGGVYVLQTGKTRTDAPAAAVRD